MLTAHEFAFSPKTLVVEHGRRVELRFRNEGLLAHNVTIADLGLATPTIQSGHEAALEFTAPAPGRYAIICAVPGHADAGMRATLEVE